MSMQVPPKTTKLEVVQQKTIQKHSCHLGACIPLKSIPPNCPTHKNHIKQILPGKQWRYICTYSEETFGWFFFFFHRQQFYICTLSSPQYYWTFWSFSYSPIYDTSILQELASRSVRLSQIAIFLWMTIITLLEMLNIDTCTY